MTDAWDVFVRGISPARLESERFGRTRALNVAKQSVAREAFNTHAHGLLVEQHHFRGIVWRTSIERHLAEDRLAVLARWWEDRVDAPPEPKRVARMPKLPPKPKAAPEPKRVKQELFTARQ